MRLNVAKINEQREIVMGTVKSVKPGTGTAEGKVVNVTIEGTVWNKDAQKEETKTMDIAFWNTDKVSMADRAVAAKIREGSVLTLDVYTYVNKEGATVHTCNNFKYRGHWTIPASDTQKERNVFMGTVSSVTVDPNGKYTRISIPVDAIKKDDDEEDKTEWASITFWNHEATEDRPASNVADRAAKILAPRADAETGKNHCKKAVVICGETGEYNGQPQWTGFDFIIY